MRLILLTMMLSLVTPEAGADVLIDIGGRTVNVHVPPSHQPSKPTPVLIFLHAYSGQGEMGEGYLGLQSLADDLGFLYLAPEGTTDCTGDQFWNGTDACCDLCNSSVDDVAFLSAVLDEVEAQFLVDTLRVYLFGYSNGAFMAYRMACERADRFAAIVGLSGATWSDPSSCNPSEPVHTLEIHGTADATILYDGGLFDGVPYPGAITTTETWASYNGCSLTPDTSSPNLDLDRLLGSAETTVSRYDADCALGGSAELWTITGGDHQPAISTSFASEVGVYLLAHRKLRTSALPALQDQLWLVAALLACGVAAALAGPPSRARRARARFTRDR
jgi:polyhydroxybutyrate depolymerase